MAKTISISMDHTFTSGRGESESVKDALRWYQDTFAQEDEETGETTLPYSPADLIVYAVRRLRALHKDGKRYGAGKLASRYYAPRLDNLSDKVKAPRKLATGVEMIHGAAERETPKAKPAPKAPAKKAHKASK